MKPDRPRNLEDQLSAYLDGELTAAERAEVEAWLARNERARRTLAELRRAATLLGSLPRAKAPDELLELITSQIERRELLGDAGPVSVPRPLVRSVGRWLASAAVIAMAVSAGWLTFQRLNVPREQPGGGLGPIAEAPKPQPLDEVRRRGAGVEDMTGAKADGRDEKSANGQARPPAGREWALSLEEKKAGEAARMEQIPTQPREAVDSPAMDTSKVGAADRKAGVEHARVSAKGGLMEKVPAPPGPATSPSLSRGHGFAAAEPATPAAKPSMDSVVLAKGARSSAAGRVPAPAAAPPPPRGEQWPDGRLSTRGYDGDGVQIENAFAAAGRPVEIRLVYADAAARDAAAAIIEEGLRRSPAEERMVLRKDAAGRVSDVEFDDRTSFSCRLLEAPADSARPSKGDATYVVEGSEAAADLAAQIVRQTAPRTKPLDVILVDAGGARTAGAAAFGEWFTARPDVAEKGLALVPPGSAPSGQPVVAGTHVVSEQEEGYRQVSLARGLGEADSRPALAATDKSAPPLADGKHGREFAVRRSLASEGESVARAKIAPAEAPPGQAGEYFAGAGARPSSRTAPPAQAAPARRRTVTSGDHAMGKAAAGSAKAPATSLATRGRGTGGYGGRQTYSDAVEGQTDDVMAQAAAATTRPTTTIARQAAQVVVGTQLDVMYGYHSPASAPASRPASAPVARLTIRLEAVPPAAAKAAPAAETAPVLQRGP